MGLQHESAAPVLRSRALRDHHLIAATLRHGEANRALLWRAHPVHWRAVLPFPLAVWSDFVRLIWSEDVFRERRLRAVVAP